jgi:hypothetical protein
MSLLETLHALYILFIVLELLLPLSELLNEGYRDQTVFDD